MRDRKKAWFVEGLRLLPDKLMGIQSYHLSSILASRRCREKAAGDLVVFSMHYRKHPDAIAWKKYKSDIVAELDAAVRIGGEFAVDLHSCLNLSIALSQGFYLDDCPLILDAITEVVALAGKLERINTDPKMEHAIKLFMETDIPWSGIRISVGCDEDSQKGFENNVRRYFKKTRGKELSSVHSREKGMKPNRNK